MATGDFKASPRSDLEIACDESGWEGSNLSTGNSDVIAYASVRLDIDAAARLVRTLRGDSRPGHEFKSSHLLRVGDGAVIAKFLGPTESIHGCARVHLTHKACFVLGRVLDLFLGESADTESLGLRPDPRVEALADELCRTGPNAFGAEHWRNFVIAANDVLRADRGRRLRPPVDAFFAEIEQLRKLDGAASAVSALEELHNARPDAYEARARLLDDHVVQPVLEPLIPALVSSVLHWTRGEQPISVVHDEQSALTERRMRRIEQTLAAPPLEKIQLPDQGRFIRFQRVDSRTDPRVQVADLLAGVARKIVSDDLIGRSDRDLVDLLRQYLDPASRWCGQLTGSSRCPSGEDTTRRRGPKVGGFRSERPLTAEEIDAELAAGFGDHDRR